MESKRMYATKAVQRLQKTPFSKLIIYEDDDYLVVNKPSFVATLDDRHEDLNMMALARTYSPEVQVCHRLDKETSGALIMAKNAEAYRSVAMQFEKRKVNKVYHAICDGIHDFSERKIDEPLHISSKGVVKVSRRDGKEALTFVDTLKAYRRHSLLACQPVTGRMHQIRVHLASVGASISGDEQYGGKPFLLSDLKRNFNLKKDTEEQPLIKRVALHARAVSFELMNHQTVEVEAPYSKDFSVVIKQLEKLT